MKRKAIAEEAQRKLEERRNAILDHQNEVEHRMMMHEMKKERYLEFKAELDALKEKNKEINVVRQRRKEDQRREDIAEAVRRKDDKIEMLHHERHFLWGLRRTTGAEIQKAREDLKATITSMKVKSNYDSKLIEGKMRKIFTQKIFNTDFTTVQSIPTMNLTHPGSGMDLDASGGAGGGGANTASAGFYGGARSASAEGFENSGGVNEVVVDNAPAPEDNNAGAGAVLVDSH